MVMAPLHPTLWVGPAGSGKLRAAREALGVDPHSEPRLQILEIGDYQARYWEFATHMEIDVMDLSMMDKQILPELLSQLLSTRDVCGSGRKVMILRRIHALSPAAATRLRACLEDLVWAPGAPAMIWATARVVNAVVLGIMDGFVYKRTGGAQRHSTKALALALGVDTPDAVPTVQSYIAEMVRQMIIALDEGPPCLAAATWLRARVYELLGLMITGGELVAGLTWATVRLAAAGALDTGRATAVLNVLARARWVPSYRTALMFELIVASVYSALQKPETK
jgi:hypothetical protein